MNLVDKISNELIETKNHPNFKAGDNITVYYKIKEGNKERIQLSDGLVIAKKNHGINQTITVRKVVQGIGIERSFLIHSPKIVNLEIDQIKIQFI